MILLITLFLMSFVLVSADCPEVSVELDFKTQKFDGIWYQQATLGPVPVNQGLAKCVRFSFKWDEDNGHYDITFIRSCLIFQIKNQFNGVAKFMDSIKKDGRFIVTMEIPGIGDLDNMSILGTDYNSWAVVSSCKPTVGIRMVYIFTRIQRPNLLPKEENDKIDQEVNATLEAAGLKRELFIGTVQTGCIL